MIERKRSKIFKTTIATIIFLIITCTTAIASTPTDIASHWSEDQIQKWLDQGLASGFPDGTFKPNENISRAEFMALTNNAFGYAEGKEINYKDVSSEQWYASVVAKAVAAGYISGYPDGTMKPEAPITRQEVAAIIARIRNLPTNRDADLKCSDEANISEWAKAAVGAVIAAEYMNGYPSGAFMPDKYITRAEALVALDNVLASAVTDQVVYEQAGLYGPMDGIETIEKDVIIKADGVTLQNIKTNGDLIIAEEVGDGTVTLNNVTVEGTARVRGGGPHSIVINGGLYQSITIEKVNSKVRIVAKGVKGPDGKLVGVIITEAVSDKQIIFEGDFNNITVAKNSSGVSLIFNAGTNVENLLLNSPTDVSGPGNIENTTQNYSTASGSSGGGGSSGGSVNNPPSSPSTPTPVEGAENIDFLSTLLSWTCVDTDGHTLNYDIYFGTDQNLVAGMDQSVQVATGHQVNTYPTGTLAAMTKYYWKVVAKDGHGGETASPVWEFTTKAATVTTNGLGYFKIANTDSSKWIEGFVTHARGGATVPGATLIYPVDIFEQPGDIIVSKDGYATTRIQNVYCKSVTDAVYGWNELNYLFEVPIREAFNLNWGNTPPELLADGITPGAELSGTIQFNVSLKSGDTFYVGYVYLGGEQRFPNNGFTVEGKNIPVTIDTSSYPNGLSYIKILVYDTNGNAVLSSIPVTINNSVESTELPGAITRLDLVSTTNNVNIGYYSLPVNQLKAANIESNLDPVDVSIYNRLTWALATGASGYKVYRSFDGVDYQLVGTVTTARFDDYSHLLEIGKRTYYKVVPFNSFGDNGAGAVTRFVIPLAALDVYVDSPANGLKDASLTPTFSWHVLSGGGALDAALYGPVTTTFDFALFDATDHQIYQQSLTDQFNHVLPFELNPGGIYSWDISYAEAFAMFAQDGAGYSYALSTAGNGSTNGENIFTTTINDVASSNISVDYLNYQDASYDNQQVLVKAANLAVLEKSLDYYGSNSLQTWEKIGWSLVKVPEGETVESFIHKLLKDNNVLMAQPDYIMEATQPQVAEAEEQEFLSQAMGLASEATMVGAEVALDKLWGLQNIHAQEAWQQTTGASNVIIAILDSGVDTAHPEFADKTFIGSYDATGYNDTNDYNGHGTHVAGIAADNGRNGQLAGIAWDSPIMPVKVEDGWGSMHTSYLIEGTRTVADYVYNNPDYRAVINMSVGGRAYDFAFKDAIDYALDTGVVFVTATGNDYKRMPSYPAAYNGVIAVGASTPYNTNADFSTTGPWISVAAPGTRIYSTYANGQYVSMDGTSLASPYVAGAAALLLSKYPNLTPIEVKNQLEQTAQGNGFTEELGYGVIDMNAMLGPIESMQYGSLIVSTNIKESAAVTGIGHGVISVFDTGNNLVAYGLTGEHGGHIFHSISPGDYQVVLSYYDPFISEYSCKVQNVSIQASQSQEITINFIIPQSVNKTLMYREDINASIGEYEIPITVVQEALCEFSTSLYQTDCDTVLSIYDVNGQLIAYNDDYEDLYSYIRLTLPVGDYTIRVEEYSGDPLDCTFEIKQLNVSY